MSTASWSGNRFRKIVRQYGVENLARDLDVDLQAVYQWLQGVTIPRPEKAMRIIVLVKPFGRLELEDIYQHRLVTRASQLNHNAHQNPA